MMQYCTTILAVILLLSACTEALPFWKRDMMNGPPDHKERSYEPKYLQGWQDGCHTGISATANQWYKMHYKFKQDPLLAQDRTYYRGWKDAFDYCQRYIYQWRNRKLM